MGMFDDIKCSYNIGPLTDVDCQTKDMDPYGGTMSFYWVDPAGVLWTTDYQGTSAIEYLDEGKSPWGSIKIIPTGTRGRVVRAYHTNYIKIYHYKTHPDGVVDCDECILHFIDGILKDFSYINNSI